MKRARSEKTTLHRYKWHDREWQACEEGMVLVQGWNEVLWTMKEVVQIVCVKYNYIQEGRESESVIYTRRFMAPTTPCKVYVWFFMHMTCVPV